MLWSGGCAAKQLVVLVPLVLGVTELLVTVVLDASVLLGTVLVGAAVLLVALVLVPW